MKLVMTHVMPHMPFAHSIDEATADTFVKVATDETLGGGGFYGEGKAIESSAEGHGEEKAAGRIQGAAGDGSGHVGNARRRGPSPWTSREGTASSA